MKMGAKLVKWIAATCLVGALFAPAAAHAAETVSYALTDTLKCMQKGESVCVTRMPSVTADGSEGPVEVGGTPLKNPYNPGACPPQAPPPKKKGTAAYSSFGFDPANPANAMKYGVKKICPIEGWPGEFHLAVDANHAAWSHATQVRAVKSGAIALERDNSDNPCVSAAQRAAQLNRDCEFFKRVGQPCPLKNNLEVLALLTQKPNFFFIETGNDNGGNSLIQQAKSSGVAPEDIFIVHYGPVSEEVCNMIPGSQVVFSSSKDLRVANLQPCPNASKSGSAPPPTPTQASNSCKQNADPKDFEPQQPPPAEMAQQTQYPQGGSAQSSASPSEPGSRSRQISRPTFPKPPARSALGKAEKETPSTITRRGDKNLNETEMQKLQHPGDPSEITSSGNGNFAGGDYAGSGTGRNQPKAGGNASARAFPSAFVGDGRAGANSAAPPGSSEATGRNLLPSQKAISNEIVGSFGSKELGKPSVSVAGSEVAATAKKMMEEFSQNKERSLASVSEGAAAGEQGALNLFQRVHDAHIRSIQGGKIFTFFK